MKRKQFWIDVGVFLCVAALLWYFLGPKILGATVEIGPSEKFSQSELDAAVNAVKAHFALHFPRCTLLNIRYDEAESDAEVDAYLHHGGGIEKGHSPENVVVLYSDFRAAEAGGPPSLEPGMKYLDFNWILVRSSANGGWHVEDQGY